MELVQAFKVDALRLRAVQPIEALARRRLIRTAATLASARQPARSRLAIRPPQPNPRMNG